MDIDSKTADVARTKLNAFLAGNPPPEKAALARKALGMLPPPAPSDGGNGGPLANTPEGAYWRDHPEAPLEHEDPIGDVIVGNAVAGGLPKLIEAAGSGLARVGANATARLAARTMEQEAANAAQAGASSATKSPVRRLGDLVEKAVDLHHPLKPVTDLAVNLTEGPVDRALASPATARVASAATRVAPHTGGLAWLLDALGHAGASGLSAGGASNPLYDAAGGGPATPPMAAGAAPPYFASPIMQAVMGGQAGPPRPPGGTP